MADRVALLNFVANQPEVLPFIAPGQEAPINLERFFDEPRNVMLGDERGVVLFRYLRPGVFEGHYLLTSELRGRDALLACHIALNAMFTRYSAELILGFVPRQNRACRAISCALGFRPLGTVTIAGQPFAMCGLRRDEHEFHR